MVCPVDYFALKYHVDEEIRRKGPINYSSVVTGFWKLHLLVTPLPAGYN
jgi:hypothetical protein